MLLLKAQSLSKRFSGLQALDRVALEVERGEVHSVIGPNSTVTRSLSPGAWIGVPAVAAPRANAFIPIRTII